MIDSKLLDSIYRDFYAVWLGDECDFPCWGIVKKEYFDKHGYLDDCCLGLPIFGFSECMESSYECRMNFDLEHQEKYLKYLGFEIKEWQQ